MAEPQESGGTPSAAIVPMVAMVLGADTPIGQRVALSLAINGARLALLGRNDDKDTMEQVARRAACLGSPSVDIHELDLASAQQPAGGSQSSEQTPPNENLHMAVETVLSRQGRVDIIVSCPIGPSKEASVQQRNSQQLTASKTILELLATAFLAPPGSAHCAVINIMHSSNSEMLQWARDLPQHMATAAAKDLTGFSGTTAVAMSAEQRLAAAQGVFIAHLLLPDEADEGHASPETCRAVAASLLEALTAWRTPHHHQQQQQQQQQQETQPPHPMEEELLIQQLEGLLAPAAAAACVDSEAAKVTGHNPCPRPGTTHPAEPSSAVWVRSETPPVTGILLATGSRNPLGLLSRPRFGPSELLKAAGALPGAVLTPADPHNLEPEAGKAYRGDPQRHPSYLVHCFKPFNGETPHQLLSDAWLTPAELFYVRNHLPVPTQLKAEAYMFELSGPGINGSPISISLEELKEGSWGAVSSRQAVLQCAGNRRAEMAAVKLVEGRAPWNHGSIGNALWTGVEVWRLLQKAGLQRTDEEAAAAGAPSSCDSACHLVAEGWDFHAEGGKHFEVSIPLGKGMDPTGGVMLAWEMNGAPLLPDHGYPLRLVVPGFVGTRSVKWLKRLSLSASESSSAWQQKDYKILPQAFATLSKADFASMPPIMAMPVQSAILLPEPGSVIDASQVSAVWFRGYAWCGGGLPITRVDISADDGATWAIADIVEREGGGQGSDTAPDPNAPPQVGSKSWSWVKWQLPLQVPPVLRKSGGKWRVCCKAFNINCDSQPGTLASVWNFRGLACNAWHYVDIAVLPAAAG
ncbi:hypothetical protein OEZ85_004658 [Tetradesmus obliquus]|uniref:Sulfite oxidase n=1 Tax=Tetradesmus obliquus TaxID=3088 RepID=A0ABY8ULE1_TETOB|nr:hypothetical protein OEZ85_004658 [Tetradesmus obliquus]